MAAGLVKKFFIASMLMWMAPLALQFCFSMSMHAKSPEKNNSWKNTLKCLSFMLLQQHSIVAANNQFSWRISSCLTNLSPHAMTLLSGFVAVISVNIVIAFLIYMAMKEPSNTHQPDPKFLTHAKASVYQPTGEPIESLKKQE
ncbi:hypothetical protein V6Z12_D10G181200 [Gossypium hirsutum]